MGVVSFVSLTYGLDLAYTQVPRQFCCLHDQWARLTHLAYVPFINSRNGWIATITKAFRLSLRPLLLH
jgi:hypothetical protein